MNKLNSRTPLRHLAVVMLAVSLFSGLMPAGRAAAPASRREMADKVTPELREQARASWARGEDKVSVILQLNGPARGPLKAFLNRNGVHLKNQFKSFNSFAVDLPASSLDELASFDEVSLVSPDQQFQPLGHVTTTTGAEQVRAQTTAKGAAYTLDGTGVGIAIVDSG